MAQKYKAPLLLFICEKPINENVANFSLQINGTTRSNFASSFHIFHRVRHQDLHFVALYLDVPPAYLILLGLL